MKQDYITVLPPEWEPIADVFAALGDPMRQKILLLFEAGEELSIKTIADSFPLSRTAIVHHLGVLERASIVQVRREGKSALYSLCPVVVLSALENLRQYIFQEYPDAVACMTGMDDSNEK